MDWCLTHQQLSEGPPILHVLCILRFTHLGRKKLAKVDNIPLAHPGPISGLNVAPNTSMQMLISLINYFEHSPFACIPSLELGSMCS
jgi:hypothetical protein